MRALLLIDLQNDFLPGGALAVADGDATVPVANELAADYPVVVATQDWHPPAHRSFAANNPGRSVGELGELEGLPQVMWPVHCVQGTAGADFAAALDRSRVTAVFQKGTDPAIDSYSAFWDNGHRRSTGLADWLRARGVTEVDVLGLATDYCVRFTVEDALTEGFRVRVVRRGCRAVNLQPGDGERAFEAMASAGATLL